MHQQSDRPLSSAEYAKMCADFRAYYFPAYEARQRRMIEDFADREAATQDRIDQENIQCLVDMGWTYEDAKMFVEENPADGDSDARRRKPTKVAGLR